MRNIVNEILCTTCLGCFASYMCEICCREFTCDAHTSNHCGAQPIKLQGTISENNLSAKLAYLTQLRQKIKETNRNFLDRFNRCTLYLRRLCSQQTLNFQSLMTELEDLERDIGLFETMDTRLNVKSISYLCSHNIFSRKLDTADENLGSITRFEEFLHSNGEIKNAAKDFGLRQLDSRTFDNWKQLKSTKIYNKIDIVTDLVLELEDNRNKLLRNQLSVTNSMFYSSLGEVLIPCFSSICPNIQKISLKLDIDKLKIIIPSLSLFERLTDIRINCNIEDPNTLQNLFTALGSVANLEVLLLENVSFSDSVVEITSSFDKLKVLELRNNKLQNNYATLFRILEKWRGLKYLTISYNVLTENCLKAFVEILDKLDQLEYFSLSRNELDQNVLGVAYKLKQKNTVREFQIYMNQMQYSIWKDLAPALTWERLQRVVLSVGVEQSIVKAIRKPSVDVFFKNNDLCIQES